MGWGDSGGREGGGGLKGHWNEEGEGVGKKKQKYGGGRGGALTQVCWLMDLGEETSGKVDFFVFCFLVFWFFGFLLGEKKREEGGGREGEGGRRRGWLANKWRGRETKSEVDLTF